MSYIVTFFKSILAILSAVSMAFAGLSGSAADQPIDTKKENASFCATLISDVHIDYREAIFQGLLYKGLSGLSSAQTPVDAVVVAGDLTNYGDKKSMERFYKILTDATPKGTELFTATGNHDIGHVRDSGLTQDEARENFCELTNKYLKTDIDKIYYSKEICGYKFIALSDEAQKSWDHPEISDAQLAFLDSELAEGTKDGKPVFVVCHWPINGTNGQETVWDDGGMDDCSDAVKTVLEKYSGKNIFYISGHLHEGISGETVQDLFSVYNVEEQNGIFYVNLPAYGSVNRYGIPWSGTGFQMEVYEDEVIFRARNYVTEKWYANREYAVNLYK